MYLPKRMHNNYVTSPATSWFKLWFFKRIFSLSVLGISKFFMQIFLFFFYLNLSPVPLKNASNLCFGFVAPYIHIISKVDASEITRSCMNPLGHDDSKLPVFSYNISGIHCECVANSLYCGPTLNQFPYPSDNGGNQSQHQSRKKLGDAYQTWKYNLLHIMKFKMTGPVTTSGFNCKAFFFFLRLHQNANEQAVFISGVRNLSCFPASLSYLTSQVLILHVIVGPLSYCLLNYHFNFEWTTDFNFRSVLILVLNQNSPEFMTIRIYTTRIYLSWSCMSDLVSLNA